MTEPNHKNQFRKKEPAGRPVLFGASNRKRAIE